MVENTQDVDATTIEVLRPVAPGENVIQVGEDVDTGDHLLSAGHVLRPQDIGGLLALGIVEVTVATRLRVGIISGGDEIVPPDAEPGPGQIRDVNSYTIAALVERAGHTPVLHGDRARTSTRRWSARRATALEQVDVLILSAGSSVSTRDMTAQVIASLGEPGVLVHGVSLKPGKPTILAMVGDKPVFGLPGNPVSCMVTFDLFVAPTLHRLAGRPAGRASPGARGAPDPQRRLGAGPRGLLPGPRWSSATDGALGRAGLRQVEPDLHAGQGRRHGHASTWTPAA